MAEQQQQQQQEQQDAAPQKVFTEQQLVRYKQLFSMFDINKNGLIEAKELAAVSKVLGYRLENTKVAKIVKHFHLEENGTLTFEQFLQAMPGNTEQIPEEEHKRAEYRLKFQEYDVDGDGFVSRKEALRVLKRELGFTEEKTRILILQFDINEDGKLCYEEFVGFYINVQEKKKPIEAAFREFDQDNKGFVSAEDAIRIFSEWGFSDKEVMTLLQAHDTNKDGKLQYGEFVHFWGAYTY